MPNIADALKAEIARVARKELRQELQALQKTASHYRSEIAGLKRRVAEVERQAKRSAKQQAASQPTPDAAEPEETRQYRFSAEKFAKTREKLNISAEAMGQLIGVTGQSIYKWEAGKARPRASQLPAIAEVRKLGKRELAQRLEALASAGS